MQFRTDIATVLILLSVLISASNWLGILYCLIFKKTGSALPLLGGLFGMLGILIAPPNHAMSSMKAFFWLPLIWDYGSAPLFALNFLRKRQNQSKAGDDSAKKP